MADTGAGIPIVDLDFAPGLGLQQNGEHEISGTPTTGAHPALRTDLRIPLAAHGGACTNVPRPLGKICGACGPGFRGRGRRPNGHQGAAIWRPRYTSTRAAPVTAMAGNQTGLGEAVMRTAQAILRIAAASQQDTRSRSNRP